MLHILKSVAAYLEATTSLDVLALGLHGPNEVCAPDATPAGSSTESGSQIARLCDGSILGHFSTNTGAAQWIGVTWTSFRNLDGLRYYWPDGVTAPTVKVQAKRTGGWADVTGLTSVALSMGWNVIRFPTSEYVDGVRVRYVSGGADSSMKCGELEVYADMRVEPAPSDFGDGGVYVLHPELDLSTKEAPLVTVGDTEHGFDVADIGNEMRQDRLSVIVGIHCLTEDQLERHVNWAKAILDTAIYTDPDGNSHAGIALRGIRYPMTNLTGTDWWTSGQKGWLDLTAVRVNGVVTAVTSSDYWRGRVQMTGTAVTADVRADFACGSWCFVVRAAARSGIESPAQILHRHNAYLILESDSQYQAVQDALV